MLQRICVGLLAIAMFGGSTNTGTDIYEYDQLNRLTKVIYEDGSYVTYEYDANGNITNTEVFDASHENDSENPDNPDQPDSDIPDKPDDPSHSDNPDDPDIPADQDEPEKSEEQGLIDKVMDTVAGAVNSVVESVTKVVQTVTGWFKKLFRW